MENIGPPRVCVAFLLKYRYPWVLLSMDLTYENISNQNESWSDWRWQLRNRITSLKGIGEFLRLSESEKEAISRHTGSLPLAVTPYYLSLFKDEPEGGPLRKTMIPVLEEYEKSSWENEDPLGEEPFRPVPGIVHRYPDRVLFLATGFCSAYCRYCTRSRLVGDAGEYSGTLSEWKNAIDYIRRSPKVRDVLITGGDPLTLSDEKLEWILSHLKEIPHVEFIRIGTKVPVVLPQRITPDFCAMIKKYHPVWMSIHFIHPKELTPEVKTACEMLADAGIPLGSQTVLLKGVNDSVEIMRELMLGLLKIRVKPYYLFHCDPISGSAHLRTKVEKGVEIIAGLRGHITGYAIPHYAIDIPGEGGKVTLVPNQIGPQEGEDLLVKNYAGKTFRYPN